jgi:hypothetical protein
MKDHPEAMALDPHDDMSMGAPLLVRRDWNRTSLLSLGVLCSLLALLHVTGHLAIIDPVVFITIAVICLLGYTVLPGDLQILPGGIILPLSLYSRTLGGRTLFLSYSGIRSVAVSKEVPGLIDVVTKEGEKHSLYLGTGSPTSSVMGYMMAKVDVEGANRREKRRGTGGKKKTKRTEDAGFRKSA